MVAIVAVASVSKIVVLNGFIQHQLLVQEREHLQVL